MSSGEINPSFRDPSWEIVTCYGHVTAAVTVCYGSGPPVTSSRVSVFAGQSVPKNGLSDAVCVTPSRTVTCYGPSN